jgi:hypothetical protein
MLSVFKKYLTLKRSINLMKPRRALNLVSMVAIAIMSYALSAVTTGSVAYAQTNPCPSVGYWTTVFDQNGEALGLNDDDYGHYPGIQPDGHQCANNSDGGANFTVGNAGAVTGSVAQNTKVQAYPDLIRGCDQSHTCFGSDCTGPKLVSSLPSWYATSTINTTAETGNDWDAGYDLWSNRTNSIGPSHGAEIFINFDRQGRTEPGNKLETVNVGGSNYDVFEHPNSETVAHSAS